MDILSQPGRSQTVQSDIAPRSHSGLEYLKISIKIVISGLNIISLNIAPRSHSGLEYLKIFIKTLISGLNSL